MPKKLSLLFSLLLSACATPSPTTALPTATTPPPIHPTTALPTSTLTATASLTPTLPYTATTIPTRPPTAIVNTVTPIPIGQQLWSQAKGLPTSRLEQGAVSIDGKIYVIGGANAKFTALDRVDVYDPVTDTWSKAAPVPGARHHFGAAELDGKLYVAGGTDTYLWLNSAYVYDPGTDVWSPIASLPRRQGGHAMVAYAGKLYVIGGNDAVAGGFQRMPVYDPATDTWTDSYKPLPRGREHLTAVVAEGKIYVIGGRISIGPNLNFVDIYDPATDTWTTGPDLPIPSSGLTAGYLNGYIHVTGGEDISGFFTGKTIPDHQVLNLATMQWEVWPKLPNARHGLSSVVIDGRWYVLAGGPTADVSASNRVDIFTP